MSDPFRQLQGGSFARGFAAVGTASLATPIGLSSGIGQQIGAGGRIVVAASIGGTASELSGGKFANGARTTAFSYALTPQGLRDAVDVAGKAWSAPNTVIGVAYGGVGYATGVVRYSVGLQNRLPSISIGNNAIQFTNNLLTTTAIALGNTVSYGTGLAYQPNSPRYGHVLGVEEMQHTYQAQVLGPFYLPAHGVLGTAAMMRDGSWHGRTNVLESGPHQPTPSPW